MRPGTQAFALALARFSMVGMLCCACACERGEDATAKRVVMRLRPDCQFLVMPEECMEAVEVEGKPAKAPKLTPGWSR